ncbi:unnamed protein product [Diplocarpon coronariae]
MYLFCSGTHELPLPLSRRHRLTSTRSPAHKHLQAHLGLRPFTEASESGSLNRRVEETAQVGVQFSC